MNEGDQGSGTGTAGTRTDERPRDGSAGWEALPPDPNTPETPPRYRAPWATKPSTPLPAAPSRRAAADGDPGGGDTDPEGPGGPSVPAPPEGAGPEAAPAAAPTGPLPLSFGGSAGEYFRIWIVNVCLTVLTLGIYSAWAKVRTKRYFYRHTRLDGAPFDYLAEPAQILKGRMVLALLAVVWMGAGFVVPMAQPVMVVALVFLVPWIVVRALRFRAYNTAWRGIRFGFDGRYGGALANFILLPLAGPLSLGLAYPYIVWRQRRFVVDQSRFGDTPFALDAPVGAFYRVYVTAGLLAVIPVLAAVAVGVLGAMGGAPPPGAPGGAQMGVAGIGINALMGVAYLGIWAFVQARLANLVWGHTTLGPHRFACAIRARELAWIQGSNIVAVIGSLGLAIPWARVRLARYRLDRLQVVAAGDLEGFAKGRATAAGATGDELGEALDLGLDLGL
jgi:uncharacterized membrane protein YjgN (DUF898 family)